MKSLFVRSLAPSDKVELLASWAFTDQYPFGADRAQVRHVMYSECAADSQWLLENTGNDSHVPQYGCSVGLSGGCECVQWIREHPAAIDAALEKLVGHLCDMRNSVVHESWPAFMVVDSTGGWPTSLLDCYPSDRIDPALFRSYESAIPLDRLRLIVSAALRAHVLTEYP
jgi:hypothetical protein